ncbi:hypothetical protein OH76DRAFT_1331271, partial [Lentinus brumalis]
PTVCLPSFTLPRFVLYSPAHGYVESGISTFLATQRAHHQTLDPSSRPNLTLLRSLYHECTPPLHPYTKASSAYSAVVQLYARSAQLDTALPRYERFGDIAPWCRAGCDAVETAHHVFVVCPAYSRLRVEAQQALIRDVSEQFSAAETTPSKDAILRITTALFTDDPDIWPQFSSHY